MTKTENTVCESRRSRAPPAPRDECRGCPGACASSTRRPPAKSFCPSAAGERSVHHTDVSAGPQLRERLEKDRVMMRHRAVGEAEQHGVERFGRLIVDRVV